MKVGKLIGGIAISTWISSVSGAPLSLLMGWLFHRRFCSDLNELPFRLPSWDGFEYRAGWQILPALFGGGMRICQLFCRSEPPLRYLNGAISCPCCVNISFNMFFRGLFCTHSKWWPLPER